MDNQRIFKEQLIKEINKIKPTIENKSLENSILNLSQQYLVTSQKSIKQVEKNDVMKYCNLDFEINLVNNKVLPASNHQIGHIIVGGLRIPGMKPPVKKHLNDLWKCSIGVAVEKDFATIELLTYVLDVHLNEDTFNEACKKSGINLKKNELEEHALVNAIFFNEGLKIIEKDFS